MEWSTRVWATPTSGADRVLYEAAWQNEKVINWIRIGYGTLMGLPAIVYNLIHFGSVGVSWSLFLYALFGVGMLFVLRAPITGGCHGCSRRVTSCSTWARSGFWSTTFARSSRYPRCRRSP